MKLKKIITLANAKVEIPFRAMERSLRNTGCDLPLWVIPYTDDALFDLPDNAQWWKDEPVCQWLSEQKARPVMRKYQCMLEQDYQFIDSDAIFIRNPQEVLVPHEGWISSCCHWHNPGHTYTEESLQYLQQKSTVWQSKIFNTGQFACDRPIFDSLGSMQRFSEDKRYHQTILDDPFHEQPGINLMVNLTDTPIANLTLPPHNMESTWAGDYPGDYSPYWKHPDTKPYLIHWAGKKMDASTPIDQLFYQLLTPEETEQYNAQLPPDGADKPSIPSRFKRAIRSFKE